MVATVRAVVRVSVVGVVGVDMKVRTTFVCICICVCSVVVCSFGGIDYFFYGYFLLRNIVLTHDKFVKFPSRPSTRVTLNLQTVDVGTTTEDTTEDTTTVGDAEGTEEEAEATTTVDTTAMTTVTEDTTVDTTATTTVVDAEGTAAAEEGTEVEEGATEGATEAAAAEEEGRRCAATSSVAGASVRTAVSATAKAAEDVAADSAEEGVNPVVRRHSSRVTGTARTRSASFTTLQLALRATSVARINLPAPVAKAEGEAAREDVAARRVRVGTTAGVRARVVVTADRRASAGRVAAARLRKLRQSQPKPRRKGARDSAKERVCVQAKEAREMESGEECMRELLLGRSYCSCAKSKHGVQVELRGSAAVLPVLSNNAHGGRQAARTWLLVELAPS